jgi:hypothetical protein
MMTRNLFEKFNFAQILFLLLAMLCGSANAQAKVDFSVVKMNFINGDTCQIFISGVNSGDRQISLGIDFRINAKNGDLIKTSARVFELRKGKELIQSVYADNEKCGDVGSLVIQNILTCTVEGDVVRNNDLCLKVISFKKGVIPIRK